MTQRITAPMPVIRKTRPSPLQRILKGRHSSLDVLFEKSYSMKMGEFSGARRKFFFVTQPDIVNRCSRADVEPLPQERPDGDNPLSDPRQWRVRQSTARPGKDSGG